MAKLFFYYSAMNAGKTTTLLQSAYNYRERGMRTLIVTPRLDNRAGEGIVSSRIGLKSKATVFEAGTDLFELVKADIEKHGKLDCVLVDEAQFLGREQVWQVSDVVDRLKIPAMNGWNQSLHGIVWTEPTTMFPVPISMAATWNPRLVQDVAAAIADEGRAINNYWPTVQGKVEPTGGQGQSVTVTPDGRRLRHNGLVYRSPVINISRDP